MAHNFVAIDPLALLLSPSVYIKLTLPDPPPIEVLRPLLRGMDATERRALQARIKTLGALVKSVEKELAAGA